MPEHPWSVELRVLTRLDERARKALVLGASEYNVHGVGATAVGLACGVARARLSRAEVDALAPTTLRPVTFVDGETTASASLLEVLRVLHDRSGEEPLIRIAELAAPVIDSAIRHGELEADSPLVAWLRAHLEPPPSSC